MESVGVLYSEFVKEEFEVVLGREAGVDEIAFYLGPVFQSPVIEHFQIVGDYKGNITEP